MFYRVRQFIDALFPRLDKEELQHIRLILPSQAYALFLKQPPAEQKHALKVARLIESWGSALPPNEKGNLLRAALLHDCGKSFFPLRIWQRVFIVLLQKYPQTLQNNLAQSSRFFSVPLRLASRHAAWGSRLARQAGLSEEVCLLIREHHQPQTPLGQLLHQADNLC